MQQQQEGGRALDCLLRQPCKLYNQLSGGGGGVVHGNSSTTGAVHNAGVHYRGGSTDTVLHVHCVRLPAAVQHIGTDIGCQHSPSLEK